MDTNNHVQMEIFHKDYNLDKKDNLDELPKEKAIYGIFAIVEEKPINCRFVGETDNLQEAVRNDFENPHHGGFKKFMQGPWIQMLVYNLMPDSTKEDREKLLEDWKREYDPKCDEEGEYPGYYDY